MRRRNCFVPLFFTFFTADQSQRLRHSPPQDTGTSIYHDPFYADPQTGIPMLGKPHFIRVAARGACKRESHFTGLFCAGQPISRCKCQAFDIQLCAWSPCPGPDQWQNQTMFHGVSHSCLSGMRTDHAVCGVLISRQGTAGAASYHELCDRPELRYAASDWTSADGSQDFCLLQGGVSEGLS